MIELNRKYQPELNIMDSIELVEPAIYNLDNKINLFAFDVSNLDFVKIDFVFEAGSKFHSKNLIASFTTSLMLEGADDMNSKEISEAFDFMGANISANTSKDYASISLTVLNEYLETALNLLSKIFFKPNFDENELDTFLNNKIQAFIVNNQKVDYIARNNFMSLIFGENHPYGKINKRADFENISPNELQDFYKNYFTKENCNIIISGKVKDKDIKLINSFFGNNNWNSNQNHNILNFDKSPSINHKHFIQKDGAMQNAIRIGKEIINREHKDYFDLAISNTVLGGFFGSRLMKNIREDKGYTYGIGSAIASMKDASVFFITSEVGSENSQKAIDEIYAEINKLANSGLDNDELELVKNYLQGSILRKFDGPFAIAERFKELYINGLDYSFYLNYLDRIKNINSIDIQNAVEKHILNSNLFELIVGNNNTQKP